MQNSHGSPIIRPACHDDGPALRAMHELSFRTLGGAYYEMPQIEAFLRHVGTLDDFLLHEGTYYVADVGGTIVASGGWSRRRPNYANAAGPASYPAAHGSGGDAPKIRSVFVHPDWARRGLARRLLERSEDEARQAGYETITLTATLSGLPLYTVLGYEGADRISLALPGELELPVVPMRKRLAAPTLEVAREFPVGIGG